MSMRPPQYNMGRVDWIGAESVGVPGQRTFRLLANNSTMSAQLWLEKEELDALTKAIARMLLEIDTERGFQIPQRESTMDNPKPSNFPVNPDFDMQLGSLSLSYDTAREMVVIEATTRGEEDTEQASLRCQATRDQTERLQVNALDVLSAGRPRCPLCGTPLPAAGVPHFCPPTNGHQKLIDE
jgi:uncharacterized repeat protein (TIGR03847 family)